MKQLATSALVLCVVAASGAAWAGKPAPVDVKARVFLAKKGAFSPLPTVAPKAPKDPSSSVSQLDQHPDEARGILVMVKLEGTGTGKVFARVKQGKRVLRTVRKRVNISGASFVPVWVDTTNYCTPITIFARAGKARVVRQIRFACGE